MIIDLLQDKNNIVSVDYSDTVSSTLTSDEFSTKNVFDISSWKINSTTTSASLVVQSVSVCNLSEVDYTVKGPFKSIRIETSLDNINWKELPFIKDTSNTVYKFKETVNGTKYYFNTSDYSVVSVEDINYPTYAFNRYNQITRRVENLYSKLEFVYLKITVTYDPIEYPTSLYPFYFTTLNISIDEIFDDSAVNDEILTVIAGNFYKQKIFETQDFLPDMIKTFLKMLQSNTNTDGSRNGNDAFYQLINMDSFSSVEKMLLSTPDKDLSFNPVSYNQVNKKYDVDTVNNIPVEININNTSQIRDYIINQYMLEYKNIFKDIYNRNLIATSFAREISDEEVLQLNNFMLKNISKFNSIKGSKKLIEVILSLYADIFGFALTSVIAGQEQNFVYRITTDIPMFFWNKNIKPIVHPCGWNVIYNYIDSVISGLIVQDSPEQGSILPSVRETYSIDTSVDNINVINLNTQYEGQMINNILLGQVENSVGLINSNVYNFELNTDARNAFVSEFDTASSFKVSKNTTSINTYNISYNIPGVANSYTWKIYKDATLINTIETTSNSLMVALPIASGYSITLTLNFNFFSHTLTNTPTL